MLELKDVAVRYSESVVGLHPVSLSFSADQVTVLLGQSGAGKSTLLRALNLLTKPTQGRITVEGIGELSTPASVRAHRCRTAMIFQQHQLIGRLTALQNVLMGRIGALPSWRSLLPASREDRIHALRCLDRVGLVDRALERTENLSGGQQQRVGIARALIQDPRMILADEPVASLDPATSRKVLEDLHEISRTEKIPAIISLHQLELAREFADRIIGLSGGKIVFDGPAASLETSHLEQIYGEYAVTQTPPTPDIAAENSGRFTPETQQLEAIG